MMTAEQLADITPEQVPTLPWTAITTLPLNLLQFVTANQLRSLGVIGWAKLTTEQRQALKPAQEILIEDKRRENARKRQAERDELLDELGANDFDGGTEWLIEKWFPVGCLSMVYGDSKTGKSTFVRALAAGIATGTQVFPSFPWACGDGLYLASEDRGGRFKEGITEQIEATPLEEDEEYLWNSLKVIRSTRHLLRKKSELEQKSEAYDISQGDLDHEDIEDPVWARSDFLRKLGRLLSLSEYKFLIVDHVSKSLGNLPLKCDDSMRGPVAILCNFAEEHDIALILIHHSRDTDKGWENKKGMLGGTVLKHQSRSVIRVERTKAGHTKVIHESSNHGPDEKAGKPPVLLEWVGGALREVKAQAATQAPAQAQETTQAADPGPRLVQWLRDHPDAAISPDSLRQQKSEEPRELLAYLCERFPELTGNQAKAAALACLDNGTLITRVVIVDRNKRTILSIPDGS